MGIVHDTFRGSLDFCSGDRVENVTVKSYLILSEVVVWKKQSSKSTNTPVLDCQLYVGVFCWSVLLRRAEQFAQPLGIDQKRSVRNLRPTVVIFRPL